MYKIFEKSGYNIDTAESVEVGSYETYDEAQSVFENRVVAFLEGVDEEPVDMSRCAIYFFFEYEDGEEYELSLEEVK